MSYTSLAGGRTVAAAVRSETEGLREV